MIDTAAPAELTERDALRHRLPDHPSAREAMYWVICLPEERLGISVYAYIKPTGEATQVVLGWGPELRTALLDEVRDVAIEGDDLDDFRVGRLHMRQPDPLRTWEVSYAVNGYVLRDGALSPIVDARFDGTYEADLHPRTVELEVHDAAGRVTRARGERFGGTVFPFPGVELTETGFRFEIEGRPGVGLCEMLWPEGYRAHLERTWGRLGGH